VGVVSCVGRAWGIRRQCLLRRYAPQYGVPATLCFQPCQASIPPENMFLTFTVFFVSLISAGVDCFLQGDHCLVRIFFAFSSVVIALVYMFAHQSVSFKIKSFSLRLKTFCLFSFRPFLLASVRRKRNSFSACTSAIDRSSAAEALPGPDLV